MYSIKEMSILSGIKPHTIRVWERRYSMFTPQRTDTNIRRYSEDDLKRVLNTVLLQSMGYKISKIAKMSLDEISKIVTTGNKYISPPPVPESLMAAAMKLDKAEFSRRIIEAIDSKGVEWTFENLLVPFQHKVGLLWQAGTLLPAHEHFTSNVLRDIIIKCTLDLRLTPHRKQKFLFFLPQGELHEIGLLYYNYIAVSQGFPTLYLGQNVPLSDVIEIALSEQISSIFTSVSMPMPLDDLNSFFSNIYEQIPKVTVYATGGIIEKYVKDLPSNLIKVPNAQKFREAT